MSRRLTPLQAMSMALDLAAERGRQGDPAFILQCLPDNWGLVDTRSVAEAVVADLVCTTELGKAVVGIVDESGTVYRLSDGDPWAELPEQALVPEQRMGRVRGTDDDCGRCGKTTLRTIDPEYEPGGRICDECGWDSRDR